MGKLKIGCCGFAMGMRQYFAHFKLVEVQQTFYRLPRLETAMSWRKRAPPEFEFSIKAWQLITHHPSSPTYRKAGISIAQGKEGKYGFFRPSDEVMEAWQRTEEIAAALWARVVVFQCPARFFPSPENVANMRTFFQALGKREFLFAWEPRGDWSEEMVTKLCQELGLIHCVDPFERTALYGKPRYFRLHGGPRYRHRYSDEELRWLVEIAGGDETYFLFNNITMYQDALRFDNLVRELGNR